MEGEEISVTGIKLGDGGKPRFAEHGRIHALHARCVQIALAAGVFAHIIGIPT
jgi:hypothetical protein